MLPLLLTLYGDGENTSMFTLIVAIVSAAVTNVVSDVKGVVNGTESWKTAVLNTALPYAGKVAGSYFWPTEPVAAEVVGQSAADTTKQTDIAMAIVAASGLALVGGTIYYFVKESKA
jgi:hypothetical protein